MRRFVSVRQLCLLALVAIGISACTPSVVQHGNVIAESELAQVQPGRTTRAEVGALLGSPSTQGAFDDRWFYVNQKTEVRSFFQRSVASQEVIEVSFDEADRVRDLRRYDLDQARAIEPAEEETRTAGNDISVIEQLLGNIGRFDTPDAPSR